MSYIPLNREDIKEMLKDIGVSSIKELFSDIPEEVILKRPLNLPSPLTEMEVKCEINKILAENKYTGRIFLGSGAYFHYVPSTVNYVLRRGEFYTSYTPYQPEMSQGILQALFEFQSVMSDLTHADVTNASMYDGATSLAEAVLMAERIKGKEKVLVAKSLNPLYKEVLHTYLSPREIKIETVNFGKDGRIDLDELEQKLKQGCSSFVIQSPNYFGIIEDVVEIGKLAKDSDTLFILSVAEMMSLGILTPPFDCGVDILAGEAQSLGIPLNFGGPYIGVLQTKKDYLRQMPGRIVGETEDANGQRCFVMTLRTREQDIRRSKATSNICSNHTLNALAVLVYLCTVGPTGFKKIAELNYRKAHYLARRFEEEGCPLTFSAPFFNEFAVNIPFTEKELRKKLSRAKIAGGIPLKDFGLSAYLFAVTEMISKEDIELLIQTILEG